VRTQRTHGLAALLVPVAAASERQLLLAGAAVLLLAAGAVGYRLLAARAVDAVSRQNADTHNDLSPSNVTNTGRERALGYTTFPERKRAVSPESRYQARRIRAACEARGMVLHKLVGDVQSYSGPDLERPGLNHALELLGSGEASCLVVAGLDRLSRSAANLGTVIEWLEQVGGRLVVIDLDLDTDTEEGRVAARALVRVGALERRSGTGVMRELPRAREARAGRPAVADLPLLQRRIATMRASGLTLQAIADTLNEEGVPTLRGGAEWRPSSVQAATGYKRPSRHPAEPPA
jgi:DNA invertase Pin-like site-specific DNA recombinase